jgi:peptidoglycan/LPS O-acetylase OafA/YrhL
MSPSLIFKLPSEPALDGLRALAVLSVMVFHANPLAWTGGFLGVDLFFVLSGYLISSLLLKEHESTGRIDIKAFYIRRWWRLGPALLVLLAVYALVVFAQGGTLAEEGLDIALTAAYVTNWSRAFDWRSPLDLGHTWSLAVEEQFYLIWPWVLWAVLRFLKQGRHMLAALICLLVLSWAWRQGLHWQGASINRLYNGLDTRVEALIAGSLLAVWQWPHRTQWHHGNQYWPTCLLTASFALLLVLMHETQWTDGWLYSYGMSAVALLGCVIIWGLHIQRSNLWCAVLRWRPLVYLGQISYGLYLWHFPIDRALIAQGLQGWTLVAMNIVLTVAVASVSYRWLEKPLLRMRA